MHGLRPQRGHGLQPLGRPPHRRRESPHGRPRDPRRACLGTRRTVVRHHQRRAVHRRGRIDKQPDGGTLTRGAHRDHVVQLLQALHLTVAPRTRTLARHSPRRRIHRRHGPLRSGAVRAGAAGTDVVRRLRHNICASGPRLRPRARPALDTGTLLRQHGPQHKHRPARGEHRGPRVVRGDAAREHLDVGRHRDIHRPARRRAHTRNTRTPEEHRHSLRYAQRSGQHAARRMPHRRHAHRIAPT